MLGEVDLGEPEAAVAEDHVRAGEARRLAEALRSAPREPDQIADALPGLDARRDAVGRVPHRARLPVVGVLVLELPEEGAERLLPQHPLERLLPDFDPGADHGLEPIRHGGIISLSPQTPLTLLAIV